jgi:hypothetical protein
MNMKGKRDLRCEHCGRLQSNSLPGSNCAPPFKVQPHCFSGRHPSDRREASEHYQRIARKAKQRRWRDWFELHTGDLHRQVYYAWRDYPDAMKLSLFVFVGLGAMLTVGSAMLIVALGYGYTCP